MGLADTARALIDEWVQVADIVKVSDEDMRWIAPDQSPLVVAAEWSTRGPKLVVLTEGSQGVVAYALGKLVCVLPGVPVAVSDTVGAGDTFMAWLVRGYVELPVEEREESFGLVDVIAMANHAAALTCTQRGCNPPAHRDVRKFYLYTNH
jgi:fructokinase